MVEIGAVALGKQRRVSVSRRRCAHCGKFGGMDCGGQGAEHGLPPWCVAIGDPARVGRSDVIEAEKQRFTQEFVFYLEIDYFAAVVLIIAFGIQCFRDLHRSRATGSRRAGGAVIAVGAHHLAPLRLSPGHGEGRSGTCQPTISQTLSFGRAGFQCSASVGSGRMICAPPSRSAICRSPCGIWSVTRVIRSFHELNKVRARLPNFE